MMKTEKITFDVNTDPKPSAINGSNSFLSSELTHDDLLTLKQNDWLPKIEKENMAFDRQTKT